MKKYFNFDGHLMFKYDDEYLSLITRKCKCGHSVAVKSRYRREICSNCGRYVFLTKEDEFKYRMKRKLIK